MIIPNTEERLETIVRKLYEIKTTERIFLDTEYTDETSDKEKLPVNIKNWKAFKEPHLIFDCDKYFWFKCNFEINAKEGEKGYLSVDTHIYNGASTIRPQGLLYLNGKAVQGIDINHGDVLLNNGKYEMYLLFYTHTFDNNLLLDFSVKYVNTFIEAFAYDLGVIMNAMKMLEKKTNDYIRSAAVIEKTLNLIDFRSPYSEEFMASVKKAREYLYENYFNGICGSKETVACVGQTHIDVAWMWDLDQTKRKVERSFSTVLKLMDEYPEYKFMSTQPQLFAFLKETNPELYGRVKERISEGRWEVEGAMWLEADCNLTCGESLVRQIAHGKRFFRAEFNKECESIWIPDVFGYSGAMPQIMVKSGLKNFITAKIGWNDTDRMPYDFFTWKGIDGSEVFAYLLSTCDADPRNGVYDTTYTFYCAPLIPKYVLATWNRFQQKEFNDTVILSYGYGDGGGGPTREDLENQRRLSYGLPGLPKTEIMTLKESVERIKDNYDRSSAELRRKPVWNGELYFEYHRGTLTSVPRIKKNNRTGEISLLNAELFAALADKVCKETYPSEVLDKDWKLLLLNQFHDILPGSAIEKVYKDSDEQFKEIFSDCNEIIKKALGSLTENINTDKDYVVFNPTGSKINGTVVIDGKTTIVRDVGSFGYKAVNVHKFNCDVVARDHELENSCYDIKFNKNGSINYLFDKRNNRQIVKPDGLLNEMVVFEDIPYQYDNWEMAPYHKQNCWHLSDDAEFEELSDGDRSGFSVTKKYGSSVIKQKIYIYNDGIERIDFVTDIDWKEKGQLLKVLFDYDLLVDKAKFDIQFGNVERSTHDNTSWDSAKFECAGQKWVDMSENNYGVALLNDGKYGFGTEDSTLSMTLLKSGSFPYDGASETVPEFTYSLCPHKGNLEDSDVIENANLLNRPFFIKKINEKNSGGMPESYSFISADTEGVITETVKKADNGEGIIIRMYEGHREHKQVTLNVNLDFSEAYLCDLMEEKTQKLNAENGKVYFDIKPFEIITILIK